ncbi:hypothetical protein AKJ16_DCAP25531 [Drosera capensis]
MKISLLHVYDVGTALFSILGSILPREPLWYRGNRNGREIMAPCAVYVELLEVRVSRPVLCIQLSVYVEYGLTKLMSHILFCGAKLVIYLSEQENQIWCLEGKHGPYQLSPTRGLTMMLVIDNNLSYQATYSCTCCNRFRATKATFETTSFAGNGFARPAAR